MRVAVAADARVLLACDIDRGGAFAHLYGTWALLPEEERALVGGFVLNRFRGDASLLAPGPALLEERTGVPTLGVVPLVAHGLPDEDGAAEPRRTGTRPRVAVVRYPAASNLDEYRLLEQVADVVWARSAGDLEGAALVVLPGSKSVGSDLGWLRARGLDAALRRWPGRLLGVCGGLQLLGERLDDPHGVDGGGGDGLALLPLATTYAREKLTRRVEVSFPGLAAPWRELSGLRVAGYEIRHGRTVATGPVAALGGDLGFVSGSVLGVSVHGLLEDAAVVEALLGARPVRSLDDALDELAAAVEPHVDLPRIAALAGVA
jgi:adenosylcobyric acid synthase